jgi:hypothetical protein
MIYNSLSKGNITLIPTIDLRVTIAPGAGELSDKEWDAISGLDTVTDLIEKRLLEVMEDPKPVAKTPAKSKSAE